MHRENLLIWVTHRANGEGFLLIVLQHVLLFDDELTAHELYVILVLLFSYRSKWLRKHYVYLVLIKAHSLLYEEFFHGFLFVFGYVVFVQLQIGVILAIIIVAFVTWIGIHIRLVRFVLGGAAVIFRVSIILDFMR